MLRDLLIVSRINVRCTYNRFKHGGVLEKLRILVAMLMPFFLAAGIFYFVSIVLPRVREHFPEIYELLVLKQLSTFFFYGLYLAFVLSLRLGWAIFFRNSDMELLFSTPLKSGAILTQKFIECLFYIGYTSVVFFLPIALAVGFSEQAPWSYYLLALVNVLLFNIIVTAPGLYLVLVLTRYVSSMKLRDTLMFLSMMSVLILFGVVRWFSSIANMVPANMAQTIERTIFDSIWLLPSTWLAFALTGPLFENVPSWPYQGVLLIAAPLTAWFFTRESERLFRTGVAESGSESTRVRVRPRAKGTLLDGLSTQLRSVIERDYLFFKRDPRNWYFLGVAGILLTFFMLRQVSDPELGQWEGLIPALLMGVVAGNIGVQEFSFLSLGREGREFWLVKASPISGMEMFLGKLLPTALILFSITTLNLLALILIAHPTPELIVWGFILNTIFTAVCSTVCVTAGFVFPDFTAYKKRRRLNILVYAVSIAVILVLIALTGGPLLLGWLMHDWPLVWRLLVAAVGLGILWTSFWGLSALAAWRYESLEVREIEA